jgi:hypothetical protein
MAARTRNIPESTNISIPDSMSRVSSRLWGNSIQSRTAMLPAEYAIFGRPAIVPIMAAPKKRRQGPVKNSAADLDWRLVRSKKLPITTRKAPKTRNLRDGFVLMGSGIDRIARTILRRLMTHEASMTVR